MAERQTAKHRHQQDAGAIHKTVNQEEDLAAQLARIEQELRRKERKLQKYNRVLKAKKHVHDTVRQLNAASPGQGTSPKTDSPAQDEPHRAAVTYTQRSVTFSTRSPEVQYVASHCESPKVQDTHTSSLTTHVLQPHVKVEDMEITCKYAVEIRHSPRPLKPSIVAERDSVAKSWNNASASLDEPLKERLGETARDHAGKGTPHEEKDASAVKATSSGSVNVVSHSVQAFMEEAESREGKADGGGGVPRSLHIPTTELPGQAHHTSTSDSDKITAHQAPNTTGHQGQTHNTGTGDSDEVMPHQVPTTGHQGQAPNTSTSDMNEVTGQQNDSDSASNIPDVPDSFWIDWSPLPSSPISDPPTPPSDAKHGSSSSKSLQFNQMIPISDAKNSNSSCKSLPHNQASLNSNTKHNSSSVKSLPHQQGTPSSDTTHSNCSSKSLPCNRLTPSTDAKLGESSCKALPYNQAALSTKLPESHNDRFLNDTPALVSPVPSITAPLGGRNVTAHIARPTTVTGQPGSPDLFRSQYPPESESVKRSCVSQHSQWRSRVLQGSTGSSGSGMKNKIGSADAETKEGTGHQGISGAKEVTLDTTSGEQRSQTKTVVEASRWDEFETGSREVTSSLAQPEHRSNITHDKNIGKLTDIAPAMGQDGTGERKDMIVSNPEDMNDIDMEDQKDERHVKDSMKENDDDQTRKTGKSFCSSPHYMNNKFLSHEFNKTRPRVNSSGSSHHRQRNQEEREAGSFDEEANTSQKSNTSSQGNQRRRKLESPISSMTTSGEKCIMTQGNRNDCKKNGVNVEGAGNPPNTSVNQGSAMIRDNWKGGMKVDENEKPAKTSVVQRNVITHDSRINRVKGGGEENPPKSFMIQENVTLQDTSIDNMNIEDLDKLLPLTSSSCPSIRLEEGPEGTRAELWTLPVKEDDGMLLTTSMTTVGSSCALLVVRECGLGLWHLSVPAARDWKLLGQTQHSLKDIAEIRDIRVEGLPSGEEARFLMVVQREGAEAVEVVYVQFSLAGCEWQLSSAHLNPPLKDMMCTSTCVTGEWSVALCWSALPHTHTHTRLTILDFDVAYSRRSKRWELVCHPCTRPLPASVQGEGGGAAACVTSLLGESGPSGVAVFEWCGSLTLYDPWQDTLLATLPSPTAGLVWALAVEELLFVLGQRPGHQDITLTAMNPLSGLSEPAVTFSINKGAARIPPSVLTEGGSAWRVTGVSLQPRHIIIAFAGGHGTHIRFSRAVAAVADEGR